MPDLAYGPFELEREASSHPGARAAYEEFTRNPGAGAMQVPNHRLLCEALTAARVDLGAYDHRVVCWLAGFEPQICVVIAGMITRAHQAGARNDNTTEEG